MTYYLPWSIEILPFMEQDNVYKTYAYFGAASVPLKTYLCPSNTGNGIYGTGTAANTLTHYLAVTGRRYSDYTSGSDTGIILDSSDVDADHVALKEAGVDVDDEVTRYGDPVPPMFWLRDPDGNALIIVQPNQ